MSRRSTRKPYFLLDEVERVTDNVFDSLLGLAVLRPSYPISLTHVPGPPYATKARNAIDGLYPEEHVLIRDGRLMIEASSSATARAKLERFIVTALDLENLNQLTLEAAAFRRVTMSDAPTMIRTLLRKPEPDIEPPAATQPDATPGNETGGVFAFLYRSVVAVIDFFAGSQPRLDEDMQMRQRAEYRNAVLALLAREQKVYIMTSFITCIDMKREVNQKALRAGRAGAGTGAMETTGLPVEVEADVGVARFRGMGVTGTYQGEYLIACKYLPLKLIPKSRGALANIGRWLRPHADYDVAYEVGEDGVWWLGEDPRPGDIAAPMGGGGGGADAGGGDGDRDGGLEFFLLDADDAAGETRANDSDEDGGENEAEE